MSEVRYFLATNVFRTSDAEKLHDIVERIALNNYEEAQVSPVGDRGYRITGRGDIWALIPPGEEREDVDLDCDQDSVYMALQEILPEGEAIILSVIGSDGRADVYADCVVITNDNIEYCTMETMATNMARQMLGNPEYRPKFW